MKLHQKKKLLRNNGHIVMKRNGKVTGEVKRTVTFALGSSDEDTNQSKPPTTPFGPRKPPLFPTKSSGATQPGISVSSTAASEAPTTVQEPNLNSSQINHQGTSVNQELKRNKGPRWSHSSCWLDTCLVAIYQTLYPFLPSTPPQGNSLLSTIIRLMVERKMLELDESATATHIGTKATQDKNLLRGLLHQREIIPSITHSDDYMVCLLLKFLSQPHYYRAGWLNALLKMEQKTGILPDTLCQVAFR